MLSLTVPSVQTAPVLDPSRSAAVWSSSTVASLQWDVAHGRSSTESTTVYVATDGKFLYVRFDAIQHEPVIAEQRSNDTVIGGSNLGSGIAWTDDAVWVDLWPTGPGGFSYQFEANPNGAHNEASSENSAFAPQWTSHGVSHNGGYTVTMAIPFSVIHGAHVGTWRIQFIRYERSTGALDVWSYDDAQTNPDDAARAGNVTLTLVTRASVPKPRLGVYGLDDIASGTAGGSTSRVGADFSVPVSQTAAFYGTFHPDYSNVEIDQQSISPTVYQRIYSEVRPFFTQGVGYYNNFDCVMCNSYRTSLYTPAIPTPVDGYAFEGRQGDFGIAAFDAIGESRNDSATGLTYTSANNDINIDFQRVSADLPGLTDVTNQGGISWTNGKYLSAYVNYATESGTDVLDPSQGAWLDSGMFYENQDFGFFVGVRKVGAYFNPVDGFDSHPGIAGYGIASERVWTFAPQSFVLSAGVIAAVDRYQGVTQGQAQSDNLIIFDMLTKSAIDFRLETGSNYWRFGDILTPISQSAGAGITFHSGTQNNMNNFPTHGSSATPTSISYSTGRYGLGRLDTWLRSSSMRVGSRGSLTLTVDDTAQWLTQTPNNIQWFDGVSYAYQIGPNSSVAVGIRRVIGFPPQPNGGGDCEGACSNISIAYHLRLKNEEIYAAYGDPNTLTTVPQAIFKVIFYAGGEKGT